MARLPRRLPRELRLALVGGLVAATLAGGASEATPAPPQASVSAASAASAVSSSASRPASAGGVAWSSLSAAQRSALAPLQREWPQIAPDNKQKWLEMAARYPGLPEAERTRIQARMAEWARLSPQERTQARLHFQQARRLTAQERHEKWKEYQALPAEQRQHFASSPGARPEPREKEAAREHPQAKSNTVPLTPPSLPSKTIAATIVQAKPGATTNLISRPVAPPTHQQPGLPKIAATPGLVDSVTLLPRRGSQGAGAHTAAPAEPLPPLKSP